MRSLLAPLAVAASVLAPVAALAQAEPIAASVAPAIPGDTLVAIRAACQQGPAACDAAVAAEIARIQAIPGLTEAQINSALGLLATIVTEVVQASGAGAATDYAEILALIANASTDPDQRAVILAVAEAMSQGNIQAVGEVAPSLQPENASPT